jgi:hypothetical protein
MPRPRQARTASVRTACLAPRDHEVSKIPGAVAATDMTATYPSSPAVSIGPSSTRVLRQNPSGPQLIDLSLPAEHNPSR